MNKRNLLIALIIPVAVFITLTFYKQIKVRMGDEIILPITGFDPRDILSGHYLIYSIDYGLENNDFCSQDDNSNIETLLCLKKDRNKPGVYHSTINEYVSEQNQGNTDCDAIIKGLCRDRRFTADIEKFYIPEEYADTLDEAVRNSKGAIVLSVTKSGSAAIKDLLIEGRSWKEYRINKK